MGSNPIDAIYDPSNGYVYVMSSNSSNVSVIGGTTLIASIPMGGPQYDGLFDPANGCIYISSYGRNNVTQINGTTVTGSIKINGVGFAGAYDSRNHFLYFPGLNPGTVGTITVVNGTIIVATLNFGQATEPWSPIFDPENGFIYVPDTLSNSIRVINGTTLIASIPLTSFPDFVIYDPSDGYVYSGIQATSTTGTVEVISGTTIIDTITIVGIPSGATYDSWDGAVYISTLDGLTAEINGSALVATIGTGSSDSFLGFDGGTGYIYVPNPLVDNVSVIFGSTLLGSVDVGKYPYHATYDPSYGDVYVTNENSGNVSVIDVPRSYTVTFKASGLKPGTNWSAQLNGVELSSTSSTIVFVDLNGTYSYTVNPVYGYDISPFAGTLKVTGANRSLSIVFALLTFEVTFNENGLPGGTTWSVTVGGTTNSSASSTIGFVEPDGRTSYKVGDTPGWTTGLYSGNVTVNGTPVSRVITWTRVVYGVSFIETGLPTSTTWSVTFNGTSDSGSSTLIFPAVPNGTYLFTIGAVAGYSTGTPSGNLVINGGLVAKDILFAAVMVPPAKYTVTFAESGLPSGTNWSATFNKTSMSGTSTISFAGIPNGSYAYSVGSVSGYTANPESGSLVVKGPPATKSIAFTAVTPPPGGGGNGTSPATFLGLPATEGYALVGIIAAVVVVGVVIMAVRGRGGRAPPASVVDESPTEPVDAVPPSE